MWKTGIVRIHVENPWEMWKKRWKTGRSVWTGCAKIAGRTVQRLKEGLELVEIRLETGRHHQIRVQMAGRGTPLAGDRKYGPAEAGGHVENVDNSFPALCAYRLKFRHPAGGKRMEFEIKPQNPVFSTFLSTK